jgi:hydroxylamine reductase (hybrid-cluster protein)
MISHEHTHKQIAANMAEIFKCLQSAYPDYLAAVRGTISISANEKDEKTQDQKAFGGLRLLQGLDNKHKAAQQPQQEVQQEVTDPSLDNRREAKEAVKMALQEARASHMPWHTILTIMSRL